MRSNLHLVLCFSPVGPKLVVRSRKFPGLFNCCSIDWFLRWPQAALIDVSTKFIGDYKVRTISSSSSSSSLFAIN